MASRPIPGHSRDINVMGLGMKDLIQRRQSIVQRTLDQLDSLEQDYFNQMNQLYAVKKKIADGFRETMTNQLKSIDAAIAMQMPLDSKEDLKTLNEFETMHSSNQQSNDSWWNPPQSEDTSNSLQMESAHPNNHNHSESEQPGFGVSGVQYRRVEPQDVVSPVNEGKENSDCTSDHDKDSSTDRKDIKVKLNAVPCSICDVICESQEMLELHLQMQHRKKKQREKGQLQYECSHPGCTRSFSRACHLKNHRRIHEPMSRVYECPICFHTYSSKALCTRHQRIHDPNYVGEVCDICGKSFSDKAKLKRHQKIHTGEKPFQCSYCSKKYSDISACKLHEKRNHWNPPWRGRGRR